jgi:ELWxxDGT repeat protein
MWTIRTIHILRTVVNTLNCRRNGSKTSGRIAINGPSTGEGSTWHASFFNGVDTAGNNGLWVTNGTAKGTREIAVSGAYSTGVDPHNLTLFHHHEVLFEGVDAAGNAGLWVTNGTTAGTHEITVSGASSDGLNPNDLVVFNGRVLFNGLDVDNHSGLRIGTVYFRRLSTLVGADAVELCGDR